MYSKEYNLALMPGENTYCRPQVAKLFNAYPATRWVPNRNTGDQLGYMSGAPDGFVFSAGKSLAVECKAAWGAAYLGNPNRPGDKAGWSAAQRAWWQTVAQHTRTPYAIALWIYPARALPSRVYQKDAQLYLVPPSAWLELESRARQLGTRTVAFRCGLERVRSRKSLTLQDSFEEFALAWVSNHWEIPLMHWVARLLNLGEFSRD